MVMQAEKLQHKVRATMLMQNNAVALNLQEDIDTKAFQFTEKICFIIVPRKKPLVN